MKRFWAVAILTAVASPLSAQDGTRWIHDWKEGLEVAKQTGKPIFVMFTAEW
jgi:hypothetical protein